MPHRNDFDIAIVGGGISGLGIARAAARHGFSVALFEQGSLGGGASSSSLRIIHSGFRYLQNAHLSRVLESVRAAADLLAAYPDIITPLPCLMPLERWGARSRLPVGAALAVYKGIWRISGKPGLRAGSIRRAEDLREVTLLPSGGSGFVLTWWDGLLQDPEELFRRVAKEARESGAELREGTKVEGITQRSDGVAVRVSDGAGPPEQVTVRTVINASGAWLHELHPRATPRRWCLAFNLIFHRQLEPRFGVAGRTAGRLLFAVPRGTGTAIGTWYRELTDRRSIEGEVTERDIEQALAEVNAAYPQAQVSRSDVVGSEWGVLPRDRSAGPVTPLGAEEIAVTGRCVDVVSTKLTTFAELAERVLREAAPLLQS